MPGCLQSDLLYEVVGVWLMLAGIAGFIAMGTDKARAVRREWRIPEETLFVMALAGGANAMAIGSEDIRHKTSKFSFLAALYAILALWLMFLNQTGFLGCLSTYIPH